MTVSECVSPNVSFSEKIRAAVASPNFRDLLKGVSMVRLKYAP